MSRAIPERRFEVRKKSGRNILFGLKFLAICVAAVFMVKGVGELYSNASADEETEFETAKESIIAEQDTAATIKPTPDIIDPEVVETKLTSEESLVQSFDWSSEEIYLLAKLAMAEAEGESVEGKALVILVILNRVWSDSFPDTIEEVILQNNGKVHQFSVTMDGGRWWEVEPNEECYEAVNLVISGWDESQNALYFESESESTWHQEHLDFLFKYGNHYFYTDKE